MLAGMSLGTDIKRYSRGTMPRIAIVAIILMPLLYGAMYLWAFWNPFGEVNKIPVAIVNADRGTVVEGQPLNAGDQVTKQLVDSGQLDLAVVSAGEARDGLEHGKYYFTITLPENFSEAIASPTGADPQKAELEFTYNDTNNYLSTIIGQTAAAEVLNQVSDAVGAQTIGQVITKVVSALPQVEKAVDGANELATGLVTAKDGSDQLAAGLVTAKDGSDQLTAGLVTAKDGSDQLAAGTAQLSGVIDSAVGRLDGIAGQVQALPADDVAALGDRIEGVAQTLEGLTNTAVRGLTLLDEAVLALRNSPDPIARQAGDVLAQAADRGPAAPGVNQATIAELRSIRDSAGVVSRQLGNPDSPLNMGLGLLQSGQLQADLAKLADAGNELNAGATQLSGGLGELSGGATQLSGGLGELVGGADTLSGGLGELSDGANELAGGLDEASRAVPSLSPDQQKAIADTISGPVELKENTLHEAPTFGTGFAPFFLSLALFVGGIITWMLLTPLQRRPVSNGLGAIRVALASYWPALLIGILQVAVMYVVVHFGVGLKPVYTAGTIAFLVLVSATWLAIIQALNAVFGTAVGRVATLATLMLMLVASGGIYPVETTAKPFQILHPYDPMTYTVNGLRQLTVGGVDYRLWLAIAVLVGLTLASMAATALSARRDRQFTMERLYPPIEV